ncbi:hypothetical protein AAVH_11079 [Aphelenchoides avenae]|nr:hypothetical protein AAVH_34573 [Aphelenchus avenae]KAH7721460.1 hypothetical protein AAVH_11079 [Aphelenchus avenae]
MSQAKLLTLFKCVQCSKGYNKKSSFWSHMETHRGKLHECDQCGKKYQRRPALHKHKRTAHAETEKFDCDQCEKKYTHHRTAGKQ